MRIIFFVITAVSLSVSVVLLYFLSGILFSLFTILIAVVQPYKSSIYNIIDVILILVLSIYYFTVMGHGLSSHRYQVLFHVTGVMEYICLFILPVYISVVGLCIFRKKKISQHWCSKLLNLPFWKRLVRKSARNSEELFPDHLPNPEECASLLHEPVSVDQDTDDV